MNAGIFVSELFLDLSKVFHCVNYDILIAKTEYAGIRGFALELIKSYLSGCWLFGRSVSKLDSLLRNWHKLK